jgi:hypothetical protein
MALSPWDLIDPVEATMLIRELPDDDPDPLLASLPEVTVRTNKPRWGYATRTRRSATFRAWNAESPIAQREVSLTQFEVELPPISEKIPLDEARRLELEGFDLNGTNPSIVQRLIDSAYDDVVLITDRIRNRLKLARTDVLTDGKFTLSGENGLVGLETDWSWDVAQTPTPSILWSVVATSSPLTDELAWDDWLEANSQSRSRSSIVYTTRAVVALLAQNAQYKQQLYPGISVRPVHQGRAVRRGYPARAHRRRPRPGPHRRHHPGPRTRPDRRHLVGAGPGDPVDEGVRLRDAGPVRPERGRVRAGHSLSVSS